MKNYGITLIRGNYAIAGRQKLEFKEKALETNYEKYFTGHKQR